MLGGYKLTWEWEGKLCSLVHESQALASPWAWSPIP